MLFRKQYSRANCIYPYFASWGISSLIMAKKVKGFKPSFPFRWETMPVSSSPLECKDPASLSRSRYRDSSPSLPSSELRPEFEAKASYDGLVARRRRRHSSQKKIQDRSPLRNSEMVTDEEVEKA